MIQYNKTTALQAIIHLFGEEGAQMFKKSAVDRNSAFYSYLAFYSQSAVCSLHFTPGPQSAVCSAQSVFYTDRNIIPCVEFNIV